MLAAIGRAINAVAPIGRIPIVRFAASDPNDIRIRRRNRDCADRHHGLFVENWVERNAAVARLEHAAMSKRDVKDKWIARIDRNIGDAAAHYRGTNGTRFEIFEKHIGQLRRARRWRRGN